MLSHRAQAGVTLIELMIGISLLAMLLALGVPGFSQWLQNSQIRTAADSTLSGLQQARAEAVRNNMLVQFIFTSTTPTESNTATLTAATTGPHWMVRRFQSSGTYTTADFISGRANVEGTPNATVNSGQSTIVFNALGRVTPTPANNITINFNSSSSAANRPLRIVVTPGGQIRMCDPGLPTSNVQSC